MWVKIKNKLAVYRSDFWETISWNFRWCALFETYNTKFYLNEINKIIWFNFEDWVFWEKSEKIIEMWISNQILWILKTWNIKKLNKYSQAFYKNKKQYENINELLKEINIAYELKLNKILNTNSNK